MSDPERDVPPADDELRERDEILLDRDAERWADEWADEIAREFQMDLCAVREGRL